MYLNIVVNISTEIDKDNANYGGINYKYVVIDEFDVQKRIGIVNYQEK